jgi:hypothetical protein
MGKKDFGLQRILPRKDLFARCRVKALKQALRGVKVAGLKIDGAKVISPL